MQPALARLAALALLGRVGALALLVLAHAGAFGQQAVADGTAPLPVDEIAPGVFVHRGAIEDWQPGNGGDIANLGVVVGSRCAAVVDSGGTPALGQRWRAAVAALTPLPVCYVIDTHAHPDHVLGNAAFAGPGTQFVASTKFNAALGAREPFFRNALARDFGVAMPHEQFVYPTLAVDGTRELDLGGRVLVLQSWPTAHTDNDLTVFDRQTRTLFASDLLFIGHLPVVDGSLRGWLADMALLAKIDAARVVPGHGAVSTDWPGAALPQQRYLEALLRETRAALKAHRTLQQAVDSVGASAAVGWQLVERFHRRNVTAAFAELEWEE
ncbi:MAG TPA: quinoprotein relay system zinc metallohydrolase 2 [Burkholderiaceae bacterium]|nr:quinoprotein relay system zinc metallohydrolase 2 [Burkholderiaceae bacterium]